MRILMLVFLLSSCVVPKEYLKGKGFDVENEGYVSHILACKEACQSRAIDKFEGCYCRIYKEPK